MRLVCFLKLPLICSSFKTVNRDVTKPLLTNLPALHTSRRRLLMGGISSLVLHPLPLFLMLANKILARRVAITCLDKFDGTVLNTQIRGFLVNCFSTERKRALLAVAFVLWERTQTCYSKLLRMLTDYRPPESKQSPTL